VLAGVLIVGGLAAVSTPKFGGAGARANTRACFANQKTIGGAVEMYSIDRKTRVTSLAAVAASLVTSGYLMQLPDDPGQGRGSFANYTLIVVDTPCRVHGESHARDCAECLQHRGTEIRCSVHGSIQ
jgi:hypothetical protein